MSDEETSGESGDADGLELARAQLRATPKTGVPGGRRTGRSGRSQGAGRRERSGRVSGARPDDRDPQPIDAVLGRMVTDHGWELSLRMHGVFGRWEEMVGAEVAQHCTPESFVEGTVTVRTDSTAWATQLKLLAPDVVRRLNQELGHDTVTAIEVVGPHRPSWTKGRRSVRGGRGPRDTYG